MKFYYFTFRSITYAQKAEHILQHNGIRCALLRTPRWMEEKGCGYCLRLWTADAMRGLRLLGQAQLMPRRVYVQRHDGTLEETEL